MSDPALESLKVPPHSNEAEQAVLGGLMLDNQAWVEVADLLEAGDFYRHDHRLIYEALSSLERDQRPFDIVTVAEQLETRGELERVGGLAYLVALTESTPGSGNIAAYASIIRKRSTLRQLSQAAGRISSLVFNPEGREAQEVLDEAERAVFAIAEQHGRGRRNYRGMPELMTSALERIEALYEQNSPITGVATGFRDLDEKTSGLQPSDLIIIAGRPSMGKTAFAVNIAETAAISGGIPVAVFSMEMPGEQLAMRMLSSLGRIDQTRMRNGRLEDEDWPRLTSAVSIFQDKRLYVDDTPALTPAELRARCRRISREHGLGLVVVDYLQLMQVPGTTENRATEIAEISRSLKAMAKELRVPVIALSQLNRSLESRTDKRPVMSDLRESGAIEQDADLILFIYRDEVYNEESPDKGIAEIIIAKQRNGPIGFVKLAFLGKYTRFENLAHGDYGSGSYG
jgi:replicative DNA helicase